MNNIEELVNKKAQIWLNGNYDQETKLAVQKMIDSSDKTELIDSFYQDLEFGTGGLRGIMGVGSNRMNKYTVGMATQGLANYLKISFPSQQIKMAIAYDCRNNSKYFSEIAAAVLSANDIYVYLFENLRPTPELSFAIRHLNCQSGIVITASHNPKEYNGFKAYWNDGAQLIAPHDVNVIAEVQKISSIDDVKMNKKSELITMIGKDIDELYLEKVCQLSLTPEAIKNQHNLKIVYTPIHGTGRELVPTCLTKMGFTNINLITEQMEADGNFPTVKSPNPEESAALNLALIKAKEIDADIVLATDPDADRVGVAIKDNKGEFILLNGNQTCALITNYLLTRWSEKNLLKGKEFIIKTIVTSELVKTIADGFNVKSFNVLTGFKFIAQIIREQEGKMQFIGGGEESYGYLISDFVRDKDAVSACAIIAEMTAWAKDQNLSVYDNLIQMYMKFGYYRESLLSITKKGKTGADEIQQMMKDFRQFPPKMLNNSMISKICDYQNQTEFDVKNNIVNAISQPKSNVLQFYTEDGTVTSIRPSGTEPKIKFYFGVKAELTSPNDFDAVTQKLDDKINTIIEELKLR
ncbi:MAG: phospho-sugar mutase [Bacteroidota bacterium]